MTTCQEKFTVTLRGLREAHACLNGYNKVVRAIQGTPFTEDDEERNSYIRFNHDEPISLLSILESNGVDDALWALRCVQGADRDLRLFAVWCARQVEHLMFDQRSKDALSVAERHANGEATDEELHSAASAARDAAYAKFALGAAGIALAASAYGAFEAAYWKVCETVSCAALESAKAALWAEGVATARKTAWVCARVAQEEMFIKMCNGTAPWQSEDKPC